MRGFPFFNLIICLFLSGGVLLPLVYRATQVPASVVVNAPEPVHSAGSVPAHVSLHFVHAPVSARLKAGETLIHEWKPGKPDTELEEDVNLPLSGGRSEFSVQIEWPAGTPRSVAELRIEPEGYAARNANIWGEGSAEEVVAFAWKEGAHE
ncbi:MAG TPA: hypothetical protein VHM91_10815 [Verrucomicrobiales bacterium]|jgi:hypothetical protein|nr:hypothetical protein [Verrucomicrobiales bacterium]